MSITLALLAMISGCADTVEPGGSSYAAIGSETFLLRQPEPGEDGWKFENNFGRIYVLNDSGEQELIDIEYPVNCWPDHEVASLDGSLILSGMCSSSDPGRGQYASLVVDLDTGEAEVMKKIDLSVYFESSEQFEGFHFRDLHSAWTTSELGLLYNQGGDCSLMMRIEGGQISDVTLNENGKILSTVALDGERYCDPSFKVVGAVPVSGDQIVMVVEHDLGPAERPYSLLTLDFESMSFEEEVLAEFEPLSVGYCVGSGSILMSSVEGGVRIYSLGSEDSNFEQISDEWLSSLACNEELDIIVGTNSNREVLAIDLNDQ